MTGQIEAFHSRQISDRYAVTEPDEQTASGFLSQFDISGPELEEKCDKFMKDAASLDKKIEQSIFSHVKHKSEPVPGNDKVT